MIFLELFRFDARMKSSAFEEELACTTKGKINYLSFHFIDVSPSCPFFFFII